MPRIGSNHLAQVYKERHKLEVFVETGIFRGESVEDAIELGFDPIYSCDLNRAYIEDARRRWPAHTFLVGESQQCLKKICELNPKPTLFWLDAHLPLYHDMEEPNMEARCPLYEELRTIKMHKHDVHRDVIMCDDTNTIVMNNPNAHSPVDVADDQLIKFINFDQLLAVFEETHVAHQFPKIGHGLVVFEPLP